MVLGVPILKHLWVIAGQQTHSEPLVQAMELQLGRNIKFSEKVKNLHACNKLHVY